MGVRGKILDNTNTLRMVFIIRSFQIIESFTNNNIKDSKTNLINQWSWIHLKKSFESLELNLRTPQRLCTILQDLEDKNVDMLSLIMLTIEHFHAKTHLKTPLMSH